MMRLFNYILKLLFNKANKYLISVILLVVMISCTQPLILKYMSVDESGYFMYGKKSQRIFFEEVFISDSFEKIWQRETKGSQSHSSIVVYKDFLFTADLAGRIYAYNKDSGKEIGYENNNGAISTSPVINKLRLFYVLNNHKEKYSTLIMFDFVNGKKLNEVRIDGGVNNELLPTQNALFVLSDNGELIKFNYAGEKESGINTKVRTRCIPASDENIIVWGNQKGELYIVSLSNGEILFKQKVCDGIESGITIDNNIIYFGDTSGKLHAFDVDKRTMLWTFSTHANIRTIPVFNDEAVFIGNLAGRIYSVNKTTGKLIWKLDTKGLINTTPLLTKNFLIQPDYNKKVLIINTITGDNIKSMEFDRRVKLTPVYYDEILYLGSDRGQIHAYKTTKLE